MSLTVLPYAPARRAEWERHCADAVNATLLHTRDFLEYHGERFADASALLLHGPTVVGLFPAALAPGDGGVVVSHPGATYGGIVHRGWLLGERMSEALALLARHYAALGCRRLVYRAVPWVYARLPAEDDRYALGLLGARRTRCELSSTIDLARRRVASPRRRRGQRRAAGVALSADPALLPALLRVIEATLARRHAARPVHRLDELRLLRERFPEQILVRCALVDGAVEAGAVFFNAPGVWHAQYIAASQRGQQAAALDALFEAAIAEAAAAGARHFDFGTSNGGEGGALNQGLYRFKSEFGGGGLLHETYELEIG